MFQNFPIMPGVSTNFDAVNFDHEQMEVFHHIGEPRRYASAMQYCYASLQLLLTCLAEKPATRNY